MAVKLIDTPKLDVFLLLLLTLLSPLFFYKLGQSSLVSWDEAWYADISRHVVWTGDLFNLVHNAWPFVDQPPGGFWLTAISFKILGISEFSARLSSAILGVLALFVTYLLGKKLFNRWVGFTSALALCSSFWFLYRARSGNLDSPLTFFFLLTLYLAVLSAENRKFFIPFSLSLAFLFTIKSLLPLAILPAILVIFWKNKIYKVKDYLIPLAFTFSLYGVWIITQLLNDPNLFARHFFHSTRGASLENNFANSLMLFKTYLHNGIGKWFWPGLLGILMGLLLREKRFLILIVFFFSYSPPFLFSQELHIWHLIPLHPIMILLFFGGFYALLSKALSKFRFKYTFILVGLTLLGFSFYYSYLQLKASWYQFIDIPAYISDEAILSKEAGKHREKILIDGDFDPAGAFYAGRPVNKLINPNLDKLFIEEDRFLLITHKWRLDQWEIGPDLYEILKIDRDKVLIRKVEEKDDFKPQSR